MAIQKINLGTEPLGEGGDTYRSANTKINENFSNTDHAASRLVGTSKGQIPLAEDMYKAVGGIINVTNKANGDVDTFEIGTKSSIQSATNEPPAEFRVGNRQWMIDTFSVLYLDNSSAKFQMAYGRGGNKAIAFRNQLGGTYTDWVNIYTNANTKKDSKSNLLLESGDTIPNDSAASRLVGTESGNVMEVGSFGLGSKDAFKYLTDDSGSMAEVGTYRMSTTSKFKHARWDSWGGAYAFSFGGQGGFWGALIHGRKDSGAKEIYYRQGFNATFDDYRLYHDNNTTIVNGNLKPSSPVVKIHSDHLELNDDAEKMGVTLNKRGVGDYLLQNTTGLRKDDGWYIELPQDVNGNPYFAVEYNELENNDIEVKTYKRIFDMNTFMFGPDLDSPVDIKEGRSVAIRFNDLPVEQLDESELEEDPLVDEIVEPEAVEEEAKE